MKSHEHKQANWCCCSVDALEPDEDCPVHGYPFPPRCESCGQFLPWSKTKIVPPPVNVDGMILSDRVSLIGKAVWDSDTGKYRCLANVEGNLCVVEIVIKPDGNHEGKTEK